MELWGAIIHFTEVTGEEVIEVCLLKYFEEIKNTEESDVFGMEKLEDFLKWYEEYFDKDQVRFMINEFGKLKRNFTIQSFVHTIIAHRRFYAY